MKRGDTVSNFSDDFELPAIPLPESAHIVRDGFDRVAREIYLFGEIEEGDGGIVFQYLQILQRDDAQKPIHVYINSPGGDVSAEFAIHDAIRLCEADVITVGIGEVASAAGLILVCGKERYVTPSTVFMAHEVKMGTENAGIGLRAATDRRKWEDWQHEHWAELMGTYCKGSASHWKKVVERGGEYWLLGGKEIVEAGIVDGIWKGR